MKLGRVLLLGLAVVAGLLLAVVGVAFSPGFQTWAVRKALASSPDLHVTVGRVAAGWSHARLENIRWTRDGAVLTVPAADVELAVLPALFRQQLLIRRLDARGWTLDLTHAQLPVAAPVAANAPVRARDFSFLPSAYADAAPAIAPVAFTGIFHQLKLPADFALGRVDLVGDVLLPPRAGHPGARAKVTLSGGNLAAGSPGKFDYTGVIQFDGDGVAVRELRASGTLGVVMDTPRTITRFVAATAAEAAGPTFPDGVKLAIDLTAAQSIAGENYAMALLAGSKQLAAIETSYVAGENHLRGNWRVDMHDTDLAPFALGRELPTFEARGEGRFDVDTTFAELNASGRLDVLANRLAAIRPALATLGAVQLAADFDVAQHGNATRVDRLAMTLTGAKPVMTVQALQAFEFNLRTGELNVANPASDLLGVAFQGLPVAWVQAWLGKSGVTVTGDEVQGEFSASARNGGFALRPKAPLTVGNLSLVLGDGRALLREVDITMSASADYAPQGWQVELAPITLSSHGARVLSVEMKAGQLSGPDHPLKIAGEWTAQLHELLAQPPAGGLIALTAGEAQGEFAASLGDTREIQTRLALTHLVTADGGELPSVSADLRADLDQNGKVTFNLPLVFEEAGRKSDLTLAGTLSSATKGRVLAAHMTSDALQLNDVRSFVLPLLGTDPAGAPRPNGPGGLHGATPFWSGLMGECALALKQIAAGDQIQVSNLSGVLRLEPATLKLVDLRAAFSADSTVRLNGALTFAATAPQPYSFAGDFGLDNFDAATVFRALDPTKPPTLEGRIVLASHLTGKGDTPAELVEHTRGDLRITGKSGVFRALSADISDRLQRTQSRVAAIGSFLGVVTDDYLNKTKILADIAKSLAEIPYDQLSLTATRDESLNLRIKDFTVISPEVRLGGEGSIRYEAGVPLTAQALNMQLTLGARGRLGDLMKRAGLLEAQQDNLGYAAFAVPLRLGGTLAKPDAGAIRDALLNSALERSGLLDGLFNRK